MTEDAAGVGVIAAWLGRMGCGYDWVCVEPPPADLLRALIRFYAEQDDEPYENVAWGINAETGWEVPDA